MQEVYRDDFCIIYKNNKKGFYADRYGFCTNMSLVRTNYIINQLNRNNYKALKLIHA